jgi:sec-independent protein translocase protein TatB
MFDIGFSEMLVIGVIALVVLGPEKLPKVARMAGHLLGRMQRYVNGVKADISREMELEELRKLQQEMQTAAQSIESNVNHELASVESGAGKIGAEIETLKEPIAAESTPLDNTLAAQPASALIGQATGAEVTPATSSTTTPQQLELALEESIKPNAPPPRLIPNKPSATL